MKETEFVCMLVTRSVGCSFNVVWQVMC